MYTLHVFVVYAVGQQPIYPHLSGSLAPGSGPEEYGRMFKSSNAHRTDLHTKTTESEIIVPVYFIRHTIFVHRFPDIHSFSKYTYHFLKRQFFFMDGLQKLITVCLHHDGTRQGGGFNFHLFLYVYTTTKRPQNGIHWVSYIPNTDQWICIHISHCKFVSHMVSFTCKATLLFRV